MFKKLIIWIAVILVVLVIVLLVAINPILSWSTGKAFNKFAPQITGTTAHVGEVDFSVYQGRVQVGDLVVGNPAGFTAPEAIKMDEMVFAVKPSSLLSNAVRVEEISIDSPVIVLERTDGKINLIELKKQIAENTGKTKDGKPVQKDGKDAAAKEKKAKGEGKKLSVGKVQLLNAQVQLIVGKNDYKIVVPDIVLEDLAPEAVSIPELSMLILEGTVANILTYAQSNITDAAAKQVLSQAQTQLGELEKQGQAAIKQLQEDNREQIDALRNLLTPRSGSGSAQ